MPTAQIFALGSAAGAETRRANPCRVPCAAMPPRDCETASAQPFDGAQGK